MSLLCSAPYHTCHIFYLTWSKRQSLYTVPYGSWYLCSYLPLVPLRLFHSSHTGIFNVPWTRPSCSHLRTFTLAVPSAKNSLLPDPQLPPSLHLWFCSNVSFSEKHSLTTHLKLQHRELKIPCVFFFYFAITFITFRNTGYLAFLIPDCPTPPTRVATPR